MTTPDESVALSPNHPPLRAMMRAAAHDVYGGPEVVTVRSTPRPDPGPGEVLIQVAAAGLDRATLHLLTGLPYLARAALGLRRPRKDILGQQVAGVVVAVGDEVSGYAVGDRVFGSASSGSFAEYAVAKQATIAPTPTEISDIDAATVGVSGLTALEAVVTHGQASAGQRVLVLGASGAVGSFAVQMAAHLGAEVTAVCSAPKLDFVRDLGAASAFDYRSVDLPDMGGPFDLIIDIAGNRRLSALKSAMTAEATVVIVGGEGGGPFLGGIERNLGAAIRNLFTQQRLQPMFAKASGEGCARVGQLIAAGAVHPAIDRQIGLDDAASAIAAMQRGELRGQAVISF